MKQTIWDTLGEFFPVVGANLGILGHNILMVNMFWNAYSATNWKQHPIKNKINKNNLEKVTILAVHSVLKNGQTIKNRFL